MAIGLCNCAKFMPMAFAVSMFVACCGPDFSWSDEVEGV